MVSVSYQRVIWSTLALLSRASALFAAADGTLIHLQREAKSTQGFLQRFAASEKRPASQALLPCWLRKQFREASGMSIHHHEATQIVMRKKALLEDFKQNARIQGQVAVVSYPFCGEDSLAGHVELEIQGRCLTLLSEDKLREGGGVSFDAKLRKKVRAVDEVGFPFYRYLITATPEQIRRAEEGLSDISGYTPICSLNVCTALARYVDFRVPLPIALSPAATSAYLSRIKERGSCRITAVEFYGDEAAKKLATRGTYREIYYIANMSAVLIFMMYIFSLTFSG